MRQNQCLINVSHLHCKCTVNSSMLLAFFVSMEILWICLSSHLLSVAPRVLPSASEEQNTENLFRTPAVSRPDPRGRRTKYSDSGVPSSFTPKHKQPETTCHWSFFSFLLLPSHPRVKNLSFDWRDCFISRFFIFILFPALIQLLWCYLSPIFFI